MRAPEHIIEFRKRREEYIQRLWEEQHPEKVQQLKAEKIWREQQRAQGRIFNHNIKRWLEIEIASARAELIIGMILTVLIKGQVVIWLIMYIAYVTRVRHAKQEALEADRQKDKM